MKNQVQSLIILVISVLFYFTTYSQEKLAVEGAIIIKNSEDPSPEPGTIRFNPSTNDFEGWNGFFWASLTGYQFESGEVTDIDGNEYQTIFIGTQEWMAANLKVSRYNDGTAIPLVTDNTAWSNLTSPGYTWYNNGGEALQYGVLYNFYTVADTNSRNICPTGWHIPSAVEWITLSDSLGGVDIAGGKLKEEGTTHWSSPNTGATNESFFTGLPGGQRNTNGTFTNLGTLGSWWSSTESGSTMAWLRSLSYDDDYFYEISLDKRFGYSIRCLKD